jgi:hypothetical protein
LWNRDDCGTSLPLLYKIENEETIFIRKKQNKTKKKGEL